jgi:osmoprotectant transport system permease protein
VDFFDYLGNFPAYLADNWRELLDLTFEHAQVVLVALLIATILGVGLGVATYNRPGPARLVLSIAGTFLTIPSYALFALFVPVFGLSQRYYATLVALTMYSLLPIVRNTITGLRGVDAAITESATGMGLSQSQRMRRIELPMAWPVIIAGIRVSMLLIVGIAAIAAVVGGPGLGNPMFRALGRTGLQSGFNLVFSATLAIVVLALILDMAFSLFARLTTSRGLR